MIKTIVGEIWEVVKFNYLLYCGTLLLLLNILANLWNRPGSHILSQIENSLKGNKRKLDKMCWAPPPRWQWCTHLPGLFHTGDHSQWSRPGIITNKQLVFNIQPLRTIWSFSGPNICSCNFCFGVSINIIYIFIFGLILIHCHNSNHNYLYEARGHFDRPEGGSWELLLFIMW